MKAILFALFVGLLMVGCGEDEPETQTYSHILPEPREDPYKDRRYAWVQDPEARKRIEAEIRRKREQYYEGAAFRAEVERRKKNTVGYTGLVEHQLRRERGVFGDMDAWLLPPTDISVAQTGRTYPNGWRVVKLSDEEIEAEERKKARKERERLRGEEEAREKERRKEDERRRRLSDERVEEVMRKIYYENPFERLIERGLGSNTDRSGEPFDPLNELSYCGEEIARILERELSQVENKHGKESRKKVEDRVLIFIQVHVAFAKVNRSLNPDVRGDAVQKLDNNFRRRLLDVISRKLYGENWKVKLPQDE